METMDVTAASLKIARQIDGVWLVLAVSVICLDSAGKLLAISFSGWTELLGKKE